MIKRQDLRIRDPYIFVDYKNKIYYMYGTTSVANDSLSALNTFSAYTSKDLENFEGPFLIFDGNSQDFWATQDFWAAELHFYQGKYYLFGSFKAEGKCRATQILVSNSPLGPFMPISEEPQTPWEQECLDGTFWLEDGRPYLVYSHEWIECCDGEICAVELSEDLSTRKGKPFVLFKASDNPAVYPFREVNGRKMYVTDGPFLIKTEDGIEMFWSSFDKEKKYSIFTAKSKSLQGKFEHFPSKYPFEGGHCMVFVDLNGNKKIALHSPNEPPLERPVFFAIDD